MLIRLRSIRRLLGPAPSGDGPFRLDNPDTFLRAQTLIRAFYAFLLGLALWQVPDFANLVQPRELDPLWPVAWLEAPGSQFLGLRLLLGFYLGSSIFAAVSPSGRTARWLVFLGLLEFVALKNSTGKIGHSLHLPILASLALLFLPPGWERSGAPRAVRASTLLVFGATQALLLLTYSMSGLGKLGGGLYELFTGQFHPFQPEGFSRVIAERLLQTHSTSVAGAWLIEHPFASWPLLPLAIYVQMFAIVAAFRPALHRPWGLALILLHVGNSFILTIHFPVSGALLALFLLCSPFASPGFDSKIFFAELPLLSALRRVLRTRAKPA